MSRMDVAELLRHSPFAPLGAEIDTLAALMVSKRVGRQEMVFWEGDLDSRFFILGEGRLKAFRKLPEGKDITVFMLSRGDCFGFLPLLDGSPYPLSVEALEASTLLFLGRDEFKRFIKEHPDAAMILLAHLAGRLRGCLDQVETIGRQGALARTAHGLMSLVPASENAGEQPEAVLPFTQEEFAHVLHLAPENLSRALARLQKEGAIQRLGKRRFRIVSLKVLRNAAGQP